MSLRRLTTNATQALRAAIGISCIPKKAPFRGKVANANGDKFHTGEDSYFLQDTAPTLHFGVADGVGGWADVGVDPSIFSTGLMAACKQIASLRPNEAPSDKETALSSKDLLVNAYGQLAKQPKLYPGSSTACIGQLHKRSNQVDIANLGDSGFYLIRNGTIALKSKEQLLGFNCPAQVGFDVNPPYPAHGQISDAQTYTFAVQPHDVIVLVTDGVIDNVFPQDILDNVLGNLDKPAQHISDQLAALALAKSRSSSLSPFGVYARSVYGAARVRDIEGGKPDDITALVLVLSA